MENNYNNLPTPNSNSKLCDNLREKKIYARERERNLFGLMVL